MVTLDEQRDALLALTRAEKQKPGKLYMQVRQSPFMAENGKYGENYVFDTFRITTLRSVLSGPVDSIVFSSERGSVDVRRKYVPAAFSVELTYYPFGNTTREEITAPKPTTRGRILSLFHEIAHTQKKITYSEEQLTQLENAYAAIRKGGFTSEQANLVINEERECWEVAFSIAAEIDNEIGSDIISGITEAELHEYANARSGSYQEAVSQVNV